MAENNINKRISELHRLSNEFAAKAKADLASKNAYEHMAAGLEKNRPVIEMISGDDKKPAPKHAFIFLIDGSASMAAPIGHNTPSPLSKTLDSVANLQAFQPLMKEAPAIASGMWGDCAGGITWLNNRDLTDTAAKKVLEHGLNSGSDLSSGVADMQMVATYATGVKQHYVIVSDGDISDADKSKPALEKLLTANPAVTLDFIVFSKANNSAISQMAKELAATHPHQVGNTGVSATDNLTTAFIEIVGAHIATADTKPKNVQAPKAA